MPVNAEPVSLYRSHASEACLGQKNSGHCDELTYVPLSCSGDSVTQNWHTFKCRSQRSLTPGIPLGGKEANKIVDSSKPT